MEPTENTQNIQITEPENVAPVVEISPASKSYLNLRRVTLIVTTILVFVLLIALLYLNGKSLYDNGL